MDPADVAPTAELQELVLVHTQPDPARFGPITNPMLDAAAVSRLRSHGVHEAVLAACCADEEVLDAMAAVVVGSPGPSDPIDIGITSWQVKEALAANPRTSERTIWTLATTNRAPEAAARVTADAVEGRDSELRRRLQTGTVPVLVLTELACQPRADTIIGLLDDDRLGHLASLLDRGPHIRTNGQLAAAWIQRTTTEQLVIALGAFRPAEHDTWLISTLVLDALARKLADEPILATRIAEWAADHTATLYASPSGARLAHDVLQLLPVSDVSAKATALRDAAALHAPNVSDEALEQYPPLPGPSTELLRRRGIQDPSAWRFVLTATSFPGPAGDLVAMAEMVVGQHGQPG